MFRILSLDGGGIKGAFAASVLATLEEDTGLAVADHFDLIAGTSTGGIIAIGLGLGMSAGRHPKVLRRKGRDNFPRNQSGESQNREGAVFRRHTGCAIHAHAFGSTVTAGVEPWLPAFRCIYTCLPTLNPRQPTNWHRP